MAAGPSVDAGPAGALDGGARVDAGSDAAPPDARRCTPTGTSPTAGPPAPHAGPTFTDVTALAGLTHVQGPSWDSPDYPFGAQYPGPLQTGGVAVADYDADGLVDLYVTTLVGPDVLYRNLGDGTFADATDGAGLGGSRNSSGAAFGDIDGDGDLDLYVTVMRGKRNLLFVQQADGSFVEEGEPRGASLSRMYEHQGYSASFGDYDGDGYPDLHVTEWYPYAFDTSMTRLLRNRGAIMPGHFEDITDAAGVSMEDAHPDGVFAFSSSFADMDDDGLPDLLVAADQRSSRLFWNLGDGTFEDGTVLAGVGTDESGMGSAVGDYDGDGLLDWFVSAIECPPEATLHWPCPANGNRLYRNLGARRFADCTDVAGVRDADWGWGSSFLDYDNDGDLDLVVTNGYAADPRFAGNPTRLWENRGDGTFREVAAEAGLLDAGDGRGLAVLDYDDDGDLDLFVAHFAAPPVLYRNDAEALDAPGFLRLQLQGRAPNTGALGARVRVDPGGGAPPQLRELRAGSNFLGQNESSLHFGLGPGSAPVREVRVRWPDGTEQRLTDVARSQRLPLIQP